MYSIRSIATGLLVILSSCTAQQYVFTGSASIGPPCLGEAEAYNIALRWLQIFQTDSKGAGTGGAIIDSTIAANFTYYDEGASYGKPAPVYTSKANLVTVISGTGYSGTSVTNVQYSILYSYTNCDISTIRWESNSKASNGTGVTVAVGTPVEYKGTDYLQVDLETRLIYNVTSSSDFLNYYIALGVLKKPNI